MRDIFVRAGIACFAFLGAAIICHVKMKARDERVFHHLRRHRDDIDFYVLRMEMGDLKLYLALKWVFLGAGLALWVILSHWPH